MIGYKYAVGYNKKTPQGKIRRIIVDETNTVKTAISIAKNASVRRKNRTLSVFFRQRAIVSCKAGVCVVTKGKTKGKRVAGLQGQCRTLKGKFKKCR